MEQFVDVAFTLKGKGLPLDHGYPLFSAVSHVLPIVHQESSWGILPVHGARVGPGELALLPQSLLTLRMPAARIGDVLSLAGQTLTVGDFDVVVGVPRVFQLQPRPTLQSRFVTIKKFHEEPAEFAAAVRRQLDEADVGPSVAVAIGNRRIVTVSKHTIVGFAVGLDGLQPGESVRVQTRGIGGRRHMGAGVFLPIGRSS